MSERTCIVPECDGRSNCRKMCAAHYQRWRQHGDPLAGGPVVRKVSRRTDTCTVDDCDRNVEAMRYCMTHYHRWRRHGDPLYVPPVLTDEERFWAKVVPTGFCWNWVGGLDVGYGFFTVPGRKFAAHRWAYENLVGPIPDGLHLDHLCLNTRCVNPDHLEPVTRAENTRRMNQVRGRRVNEG